MYLQTMFARIFTFAFLFIALTASAVDLNVSVQPRNLTVGMRGYVEISAEDVSRLQLRQSPPRMDGIEWTSGISSGSSMSIINGVTTSKFTLRVPFTVREEGEYTIPSLEVVVNGNSRQPEKTQPVKVKVGPAPKLDQAQASGSRPVFANMTFPGSEKGTPSFWVGEEIPLQLSIYVRSPYDLTLANYPDITPSNSKITIRFHDYRKVNPDAPNFESVSSHNQRISGAAYTVYQFDTKFRALS
ncbi:MAG: BatD family protein, partial [Lentisphaeria bacterium]|nr:BatD family protein [Lentisphaeria bacterium]